MMDYLRLKSPWSQLGMFLGLLGAAFILTMVLSMTVLVLSGSRLPSSGTVDWSHPGFVNTMKFLQAVSSVVLFLVPALIFARIAFNFKPLYFLGLRGQADVVVYILAVVCMLASYPIVGWLGEINQALPLPKWMVDLEKDSTKQMSAFLKADNSWDVVVNVFIMAFLPAVCEEVCFRGALQRIIIHITRRPWTGIIITAILFSALHLQFLGFLPRVYLGVALGAIYWFTGSLWPSILAHFVYNGVQVVFVANAPEYIEKNPEMPAYFIVGAILVVSAIIWAMARQSRVSYSSVYHPDELNDSNRYIA